jgi:hypothetical protein
VVDITTPESPIQIAYFFSEGIKSNVLVGSGDAYLTNNSRGLLVTSGDLAINGLVVDHNYQPISNVMVQGSFGRWGTTDISGMFNVGGYMPGSYGITPSFPDRAFLPYSQTVQIPQSRINSQFTILSAPITATIEPGVASDVVYYDVQDLPTQLHLPAGTVISTSVLKITPTLSMGTIDDEFAGHAFGLDITDDGENIGEFLEPVDVAISYSDLDIRYIAAENQLWLRWWSGGEWRDAAESCSPVSLYQRQLADNVISVAVCGVGEFSLMGPANRLYLPTMSAQGE